VGQALRGRATVPPPTPGPADAFALPGGHHQHPWLVTDDGLGMARLDCGRLELVNVRPFNLVPRRRWNAPGPAPGG
jgi:hypothetical protein